MNCRLRLRPLLRMETSLSPDEALRCIKESLPAHQADLTGTVSDRYVILRINESRQHFGSPQLSFEIEEGQGGSVLSGLFMPMPSIWTAFMALYALIIFGGFCGACYGYAQIILEHAPHAFWAVPVALVLLVLVHLVSCIGQRMGEDQMEELQQFVEHAVGEKR